MFGINTFPYLSLLTFLFQELGVNATTFPIIKGEFSGFNSSVGNGKVLQRTKGPYHVMGLGDGSITFCDFNFEDCFNVKLWDEMILGLLTVGKYIFATCRHILYKCDLTLHASMQNCNEFSKSQGRNWIYGIAVAHEYVYFADAIGRTYRCRIEGSKDCILWKEFNTKLSLIDIDLAFEEMWVVLENGEVVKCKLSDPKQCEHLYNFQKSLPMLTAKLSHGYFWVGHGVRLLSRCNVQSPPSCEVFATLHKDNSTKKTSHSDYSILSSFDGKIYVSFRDGNIWTCDPDLRDSCQHKHTFVGQSSPYSIITLFKASDIEERYKGEDESCSWQAAAPECMKKCPPYVLYYNYPQRSDLELVIKEGLLHTSAGHVFQSRRVTTDKNNSNATYDEIGRTIFVIDRVGRIYASNQQNECMFLHSSILAAEPVAASGELEVVDGKILSVNNCSRHYNQPVNMVRENLEMALKANAYRMSEFPPVSLCSPTNRSTFL